VKAAADCLSDLNVAISRDELCAYPEQGPFNPSHNYPEYTLGPVSETRNGVYDAVREALALLGMDQNNHGTPEWNPFGEIVKPGDTVAIKPNFVLSRHAEDGDLFSVITHASVLRAIVDYVYIALKGEGRVIIADSPQMDCNFTELLERTQLASIVELYEKQRQFKIEIVDLRSFWLDKQAAASEGGGSGAKHRHPLPGDPLGSALINLGKESLFFGKDNGKYYGADFDRDKTIEHHHGETHQYSVSKTILSADVVILVPKLKVHKKVGATLNVKGLVGIATDKNHLIHYTLGTPAKGGDQFPDRLLTKRQALRIKLQRWAFDKFLSKKTPIWDKVYKVAQSLGHLLLRPLGVSVPAEKLLLDAGNWHGNDSAWRMAVDLLRLFLYSDEEGTLQPQPVRRVFSIVDGIIGGENNGPLTPDAKPCGLVIAGSNPCAVDLACLRLMGFDHGKISIYEYALKHPDLFHADLEKICSHANTEDQDVFGRQGRGFGFEPHPGWKGHIEKREE